MGTGHEMRTNDLPALRLVMYDCDTNACIVSRFSYPWVAKTTEVWLQVVNDPIHGAIQRQTSNQQNSQHDVGENRREINNLQKQNT